MPIVTISELADNLPLEGTYRLRVHRAEWVPVPKNQDANPYIRVRHCVTGPDGVDLGRMVFQNYPIKGSGKHRLLELLEVTGHPSDFVLDSADQLIGIEFMAVLAVDKGTKGYPDKAVIKKHMSLLA